MLMKFIRRYPELMVITILALITRVWNLFYPSSIVFDEVYFKTYAGDYLTGSYYFDPHPPLGKLLLGGWAWLLHLNPSSVVGSDPSVAIRLLPALAGAIIIPVFYLFLRELKASKKVATLGALLLLLDNALLVESRFILIDSLLILFGLSAVTLYLASRNRAGKARVVLLCFSALFAGLAASTKWTGLTALGLIGFIWLIDQVRRYKSFSWPKRLTELVILISLPALVYVSVFWVHFSLLTKTGQGDAFMPARFQSTLQGNSLYDPNVHLGFREKFYDLNIEMVQSEEGLKTATHPYASKWTSWPLMIRPIYYWQGDTLSDGTQGNIYLLGNPGVWYGILIAIIAGVFASTKAWIRLKPYRLTLIFLAFGYAINFLPFSRIIRVMFLYHYLFALIFSLAFAVILIGALADWMHDGPTTWKFSSPTSRNLYFGILTFTAVLFIYFSPLSYGLPLTPESLASHMWLPSWR